MGILHKNIHLMLLFLKAPFLVLHFSGYTLMNFLMILSVITIYPDDTTLESKHQQKQQQELASEL